jgi:hypothetical protein
MTDLPREALDSDSPYRPPQSEIGETDTSIGRLTWWQWCLWGLLAASAVIRIGAMAKSIVIDHQTFTFVFAIQRLLPAVLALVGAGLILVRPSLTFLLGMLFYLIQAITYLGPEGMWLTKSFSQLGFNVNLSENRDLHFNLVSLVLLGCHFAAFAKARTRQRR